MSEKYPLLFSPMKIGGCEIKNRIVLAPMVMGTGRPDGKVGELMSDYYEARAAGGAGLIITECCRVDDHTGSLAPCQISLTHDRHIKPLAKMVERIHRHGTKIFCQLHHPGRQNYSILVGTMRLSLLCGRVFPPYWKLFFRLAQLTPAIEKTRLLPPVAGASDVPCEHQKQKTRALTTKEIHKIISRFGDSALRAKKAGADGVELHGAHGYLIQQFLSPHTNRRQDEYGGSFENRLRFLREIIADVRGKCGENFPIIVRLSVDEFYRKYGKNQGLTLDDGVKIAKAVEEMGVQALDISSATYETMNYWLEPTTFELGWRKHLAAAVKKEVKIPVLAANFIRSPQQAEAQLAEGTQDFISLGRPWLADPNWAEKVRTGREEEITRCISCLWCFESMLAGGFTGKPGECALNPRKKQVLTKDGAGKSVVVVGAGAAGLTAAQTLAERGFAVTVLEKSRKAGGQLNIAAAPTKKEKILWCIEDLLVKCQKLGVTINYGVDDALEYINASRPAAVFLATGAREIVPNIPGVDGENVHLVSEVLTGKTQLAGKKVAVIGSGLTGLETAEYLCSQGCAVTVADMAEELAPGAYHQHVDDVLPKLRKANTQFELGEKLTAIGKDSIELENVKTGSKKSVNVDAVVLSVGILPENSLAEKIQGIPVILIGDAQKTGRIANAVHTAFYAAAGDFQ